MDRVVFPHLALLGVALLAVDALGSRDRITTLLQRLVLVGGLAACIGILEFAFSGFDFREVMLLPGLTANVDLVADTRSGFDRITAGASHPIEFSVVTAALVPLALHFALHADTGRWRYRLALIALLVAIPMSVSRSGFLTLAVGLSVYAVALSIGGASTRSCSASSDWVSFERWSRGCSARCAACSATSAPIRASRAGPRTTRPSPASWTGHWWLGRGPAPSCRMSTSSSTTSTLRPSSRAGSWA